ncbi:glycosyltransferase 87 family protein [Kocuria sp.]|uniref:glycosyltransferase 87 family protein n=1 Tax=Kocuria sp. TaxID=1871328 RepID=UPI0026DEC998|nr:glycosyltransferase 87 family protein [Kocuria sp.]MDO5617858.1 glycosyltransferase 87 family protein [Kocuria sp.]
MQSTRSQEPQSTLSTRWAVAATPGTGPQWARVLAYVTLGMVLAWSIWLVIEGSLDLMVYNMGAQWVANPNIRQEPLYDLGFPVPWGNDTLPFTYPPFAALLFGLLAWIPFDVMRFLLLGADLIVAVPLAGALISYAQRKGRTIPLTNYLGSRAMFALVLAAILFCGPWIRTISLGQVNILLFGLIFLDLVRRTDGTGAWIERATAFIPRGVLIGIAAGIKLTPLAFGLIFLMQKNFRAIISMGVTFAATVGLGFLILYNDSMQFWTDSVSASDRVGSIKYIDNTAITGLLIKNGIPGDLVDPIRYPLVLIMIVLVAVALVYLTRRGMILSAISMNALVMLFMSPISWSHHQVYYPIIALALWLEAFPHLFRGATRVIAAVLTWIWLIGAFIGPMRGLFLTERMGIDLHVSETIWIFPYVMLFLLLLLWATTAILDGRRRR